MNIAKIITDYKDADGDIDITSFLNANNDIFASQVDLVNRLSIAVAQSYIRKFISYIDADSIMNDVYVYMLTEEFLAASNNTLPSPTFEIFDAFDAGEYHRRDDLPSVDPVAKYTDPTITSILKKLPNNTQ